MKLLLRVLLFCFTSSFALAQTLHREHWYSYAYEDMSDWIRRLPAMYPLDYGVAGAPVVFRPWGLQPWNVGVERDGIPWQRASDGLYESNLDSPEELSSLLLTTGGLDPLVSLAIASKPLPADTPWTDLHVREGYYGFGRVDFAHAQSFAGRWHAEGRGRLFWYDGLRFGISKSKLYSLAGRLRYDLSSSWKTLLEYGGANVETQAPQLLTGASGGFARPQIYAEREYGTLRVQRHSQTEQYELGAHLRQDRETRESYFGLWEQYLYAFADVSRSRTHYDLGSRVAYARARFYFPGVGEHADQQASVVGRATLRAGDAAINLRGTYARKLNDVAKHEGDDNQDNRSFAAQLLTPRVAQLAIYGHGMGGRKSVPRFWQLAAFDIDRRPLLVSDEFGQGSYYAGFERDPLNPRSLSSTLYSGEGGLDWSSARGTARLGVLYVRSSGPRFIVENDTVRLFEGGSQRFEGATLSCNVELRRDLRFQSSSVIQLDQNHDYVRALDTRLFSRLILTRDFFKSRLHLESYVAYEHLGRRRAVSDLRSEVIGPAHLLHFRVEGTIEGVTLIWGAENLTAQHYYYLPGYLMIRKEEYFGLRWTLKF